MKRAKPLILGLILSLIITNNLFAQTPPELVEDETVQASDLEVSEPKILPGNFLYFLKNWRRKVRLFFTLDVIKKAELRLKVANEKLLEAKKLAELKKNPKLIEKAISSFQEEIEKIAQESGENLKKFSEKLIHQQLLHQKILQRLENQVPPEVIEKIREKRMAHLEKFAQVMQKVEEKGKIAERIGEELEKIRGSKFKDFKNLEILSEIAEKMPEDVKKKIEEKREEMIERLTEKLEKMPDLEKEKLKNYLEQISGNKLKQLEIINKLETKEISERLKEIIEEAKEKKIEEMAKIPIPQEKVKEVIEKAENEIKKAEIKINKISTTPSDEKGLKNLLENSKRHLTEAKEAFEKKDYGKAFGLANSAYHEALNVEKILEKIESIKRGETESGYCPMVWDPVCGKDGKTYSNECFAKMAKVEIAHKGTCEKREGMRKPECQSNEDCRGLICPQVVGMDTPVCKEGKCVCGAKEERR